jgi:HTH-type transcriptional regulator, competence development regulator
MDKINKFLKDTREKQSLTLRKIQELTGISSAYLSQVENGKIKKPSPSVLYKLAKCYKVPYESLLELTGHPAPIAALSSTKPSFRLGGWAEDLTKDEEERLKEYLDFLRSRRKR